MKKFPLEGRPLAAGSVMYGISVSTWLNQFTNTYAVEVDLPGGAVCMAGFKTVEGAYAAADHLIRKEGFDKVIYSAKPKLKPSYSLYLFILLMFAVFAGFFAAFWILQNRFQLPCFLSVLAAGAFYYEYRRLSS